MKATAVAIALLLSACATLPPAGVADADESAVASCRYLGDVDGASGWGGLAATAGMNNARNTARAAAARLGATHVVWRSVVGGMAPSASGRAYRCL